MMMRPYQSEDDYWRIRSFLRETFLLNGRRECNWQVARLDYWRWHVNGNIYHTPLSDCVLLWETDDGQIAAVLTPDNPDEAFFQVHPAFRTTELETAMLTAAETHLAARKNSGHRLQIWAHADDTRRGELLASHGYTKGDWPEYQWSRSLSAPIPDAPLPPDYTIRALGDELPARSWLSWRVFHPDEPDEKYEGWTWYPNVQRAPLYRRDLDLVAVAPDGTLAAFCTVWFDDVTRTGMFEPVGVSPDHQRRGLGKAILAEGMRRLNWIGGTLATVGGYSEAANALYGAMFLGNYRLFERWEKHW